MKKRVVRNLYFVVKDPRSIHVQANRRGITDEVHVMTPMGEFEPKFGCNDTATPVSRIARDAYSHGSSIRRESGTWLRVGFPSDRKYYFPDVLSAFHALVGQSGIPEREG